MHIVLVPGLLLAMALAAVGGTTSARHAVSPIFEAQGSIPLFSVAAQATTTATLTTTGGEPTVTAGGTVTGTPGIEATATLTGSVQSTPVPLGTPVRRVPLQSNPLDPNHLFSAPSPPMGPYAWAFLVLMVGLLAASGYFMLLKRPEWKRTNSVLYRAANNWGQVGLWLAIPGLLLLLFRVVQLDFFNMRFWLYLWTLASLIALGWFLYWFRTRYPKQIASYQKRQRARQYMPGGAAKAPARQVSQPKTKASTPAKASTPSPATDSPSSDAARPASGPPRSSQRSGKRGKRK